MKDGNFCLYPAFVITHICFFPTTVRINTSEKGRAGQRRQQVKKKKKRRTQQRWIKILWEFTCAGTNLHIHIATKHIAMQHATCFIPICNTAFKSCLFTITYITYVFCNVIIYCQKTLEFLVKDLQLTFKSFNLLPETILIWWRLFIKCSDKQSYMILDFFRLFRQILNMRLNKAIIMEKWSITVVRKHGAAIFLLYTCHDGSITGRPPSFWVQWPWNIPNNTISQTAMQLSESLWKSNRPGRLTDTFWNWVQMLV